MSDLVYNIDFELIAIIFTILLYVEICVCYPKHTRKNHIFRSMTVIAVITQTFDLVSAFTITYGAELPRIVNIFINSGYFMSGLLLCYMLYYYVNIAFIVSENSKFIRFNKAVLLIMESSVLLNVFFGFYFDISANGAYIHGPIFLLLHFVSLWFVACASVALFLNRKVLNRAQIISCFLFVMLYYIAVILQTLIFPDILIIMPAVTAMLTVAAFSLESPDYVELQKVLKKLTETKQELEEANHKYYGLAFTDNMTGLNNRTAYDTHLEQLEAEPFRQQVIFLIADINNLKYLNDTFGHRVGDDAIKTAAKLLLSNFTDGCKCYRIGGDEFVVISYGLTEEAFMSALRGFSDAVTAASYASDYPFSLAYGYQRVGTMPLLEALKKADEAMYQNKILQKQRLKF